MEMKIKKEGEKKMVKKGELEEIQTHLTSTHCSLRVHMSRGTLKSGLGSQDLWSELYDHCQMSSIV